MKSEKENYRQEETSESVEGGIYIEEEDGINRREVAPLCLTENRRCGIWTW